MKGIEDKEHLLKNIVFISIPDNFNRRIGDFALDPAILLPVEVPAGEPREYLNDLSWEMIIAAMLKVLAYAPEHEHAEYYRQFVRAVKPTIVEELTQTGVLKVQNKDFDIAEEIFLALKNLEPQEVSNQLNLAITFEQHADAYEQIGNEKLMEHYRSLAFEEYKKALSMAPDLPEIHYNAGFFFLKINSVSHVEKHFKRFVQLSEDTKKIKEVQKILNEIEKHTLLDTLFKEAYDFIRLGKEKEGLEKINRFLEKNPQVPNAWFIKGWALRRLEEYGEGKESFLKALELGLNGPDTRNELAICLMELGEYPESKAQLTEALRKEPENVKIISNLGILSLKQNNREEAKSFFKTVLELEPEDGIAKKFLNFIENLQE